MDEGSGSDKKGDAAAAAASAPSDWELLSMSMTASVSDLKTALAAAEAGQEGGEGGISEAALQSQYFGQVMAQVFPQPTGEIFAQDGGKQADPDAGGKQQPEQPALDVSREVEQQIFEAEAAAAAAAVKTEEEAGEVVVTAVVIPAPVCSSPRKEKAAAAEKAPRTGAESVKRRLQIVFKKVNRSSTVWSIALVATVTGLVIIGKRWYSDSLSSLDLDDLEPSSDEMAALDHVAKDIPDGNQAAAAAAAGAEAVEGQPASGGLFGSLRDLW